MDSMDIQGKRSNISPYMTMNIIQKMYTSQCHDQSSTTHLGSAYVLALLGDLATVTGDRGRANPRSRIGSEGGGRHRMAPGSRD